MLSCLLIVSGATASTAALAQASPSVALRHIAQPEGNLALTAETARDHIEHIMDDAVAKRVASVVVAIEWHGQLEFTRGYGTADIAHDKAATPRTRYLLASVSRQITAAIVLQVAAEKQVSLDTPIATILPDFPHADEITIRQLLNQTSGLPDYGREMGAIYFAGVRDVPPGSLIDLIRDKPLVFQPGTAFAESTTNYTALGLIVEQLTGRLFAEELHDRVTVPLSLHTFHLGAPDGPDAAQPYYVDRFGRPQSLPGGDTSWTFTAGGLSADALDLLQWDDGFFKGKLLSPDEITEATTPPLPPHPATTNYAFGWKRTQITSHRLLWDSSQNPNGWSAFNAVFPDDDLKIVLLANAPDAAENTRTALALAAVFIPDISGTLLEPAPSLAEDPEVSARARRWFIDLLSGSLPAHDLTSLQPTVLVQGRELSAFGPPHSIVFQSAHPAGSDTAYVYRGEYPGIVVDLDFTLDNRGKIAAMSIHPTP